MTVSSVSVDHLSERKRGVPRRFNRAAKRYDLLTGMNPGYNKHLRWSAERLQVTEQNAQLLDLCCGTGLSTKALAKTYPGALIDAMDASPGMLNHARDKRYNARVRFFEGDASDPASHGIKGPYDGILMAYGIRNLPNRDAALDRLYALLKPGGRIVFHEYSVADSKRAQAIWEVVSRTIIIPSGRLATGDAGLYEYLRESVVQFDGVKAFEARLQNHGFVNVETLPMDGWQKGIVHSFVACKE
jgi:ubiquinone/menaquinone biosynthesis methyltransferase